jgi:hypothetical protein
MNIKENNQKARLGINYAWSIVLMVMRVISILKTGSFVVG